MARLKCTSRFMLGPLKLGTLEPLETREDLHHAVCETRNLGGPFSASSIVYSISLDPAVVAFAENRFANCSRARLPRLD